MAKRKKSKPNYKVGVRKCPLCREKSRLIVQYKPVGLLCGTCGMLPNLREELQDAELI